MSDFNENGQAAQKFTVRMKSDGTILDGSYSVSEFYQGMDESIALTYELDPECSKYRCCFKQI